MFTGIVEAVGRVERNAPGAFVVSRPQSFQDCVAGASVSIAGVCLTIAEYDSNSLTFAVIPETLAKTTLGCRTVGEHVNMERALSVHGRFDGHMVQGHVEATAEVMQLSQSGDDVRLTVMLPEQLGRFAVPKGSIAIDGVSLTIAERTGNHCTVALVPHTLENTTLGGLQPGSLVNIETDMLVRAVEWITSVYAH